MPETVPEGAGLEIGEPREDIGQLKRRAEKHAFMTAVDGTKERGKVTWRMRAPKGHVVKLLARHDPGGTMRAEVTL